MSTEQTYSMEIFIDKILFSPGYLELPEENDINVRAMFGNYVNLKIRSGALGGSNITCPDPLNRVMNLKSAASCLFSTKPEELLQNLNISPLYFKVMKQSDSSIIGDAMLDWDLRFFDMVQKSKFYLNHTAPVSIQEEVEMMNNDLTTVTGSIYLTVRLSCQDKNK